MRKLSFCLFRSVCSSCFKTIDDSVSKASITFIPGYPWEQNNGSDCVFWGSGGIPYSYAKEIVNTNVSIYNIIYKLSSEYTLKTDIK